MNHHPRRRFGQNFLHDPGTIRRILAAIGAAPDQRIVEIGPGRGAITEGLLSSAGRLDVIELDRDLIEPLRERLGALGDLRIHNADALRFDLCSLIADDPRQRLRVVGNLPYNVSTPLLFRFLEQRRCIQDLLLMLQKEVVDRICAAPGSRTYGRLSVMVQTWCQAERLFTIGPGAFTPAPKVDSAVVRLVPRRPLRPAIEDRALHARIVAAAFAQRRKTLRNSLRGLVAEPDLRLSGIDPAARAESLSVVAYAELANSVCHRAASSCKTPPIP